MIPVIGPVIQYQSPIHHGIDIACIPGSYVRAIGNGYGTFSWDNDMGWIFTQEDITISHLGYKGIDGYYNVGEIISRCGSTGRLSAGPHVHVEGPPSVMSRF